jgi:putative transposase
MARTKRYYIPGHVWHITHRCHKREFLLKFAKDRRRWLHWLLEAKRRYGLVILNYMVTTNHIHLLVVDDGDRDVIPRSIQLVAGRAAREYNKRKKRKGAFWEDRYHATAIETGKHLLQCIVYIDLNMVRAGGVRHPSEWSFSGYKEIQEPRRKCALIAYERLRELAGSDTYDHFRAVHRDWVNDSLGQGRSIRDSKWTRSIAVGSEHFVHRTKKELGARAKGRVVLESAEAFQLREPEVSYLVDFGPKNDDIGPSKRVYPRTRMKLHETERLKY